MDKEKYILLTIDVEDWFQVENFRPWVPFETWDQRELRVERNVHRLLDLFESITLAGRLEARGQEAKNKHHGKKTIDKGYSKSDKKEPSSFQAFQLQADNYELKPNGQQTTGNGDSVTANVKPSSLPASQPSSTSHPKATFFVLGWLAERLPNLVREIQSRNHEIASHGYNHNLCNQQSHSDFRKELVDSKKLLEDIIGSQVFGYRAPNFSINNDILKTIEDCSYLYDSSYNSFSFHGRYGQISLNGHSKKGIAHKISENFFELPISNIHFRFPLSLEPSALSTRKCFVLPWGGGAYFRFLPSAFFSRGMKNILKKESAYLFYIHPWEIDPEQPRLNEVSYYYKLRHYKNIKRTLSKLSRLVNEFEHCEFITCSQYLAFEPPSFPA